MKLFYHSARNLTASRRSQQGFTLVEMMIVVVVMLIVIAGVLSEQYIGMREEQLMESKAGANDTARMSISQMLADIRGAKGYDIGNTVSGTNFTIVTNGILQGNSVRLYTAVITTNQTVNLSDYTLYYFDLSQVANNDGLLWRLTSTTTTPTIVASNLINTLYFTSEDYLGNTQTVRTYKGVIHTTLQFCQFQYPQTPIGTNGLFDYYRIDCRATPHLPDGP